MAGSFGTNKHVSRRKYITIFGVLFALSAILSFSIFYGPAGKEVSLRPYTAEDINNMNKATQSKPIINQSSTNSANTTEDNKKQAETKTENIDLQIKQIDEKILLIGNEINDSKRKIDFLNSQVKSYQQTTSKNQASEAVSNNKEQQTNKQEDKGTQDSNKEITKLEGLIALDQEKIANLKSQKETLMKQKRDGVNTISEQKQN